MPLYGGDPEYRTLSSSDSGAERKERPQLHRNMVTLQLPSLGDRSEAKPRVVDAQKSGLDGSLNFHPVRPPALARPVDEFADIPGLIVPEVLAMERYNLSQPETTRTVRSSYPLPEPSRAPEYFSGGRDEMRASDDFGLAASDPMEPQARFRRRDYPEDRVPDGVSFARIEIPSPVPQPAATVSPERVLLPPPLPEPAARTTLAALPGAAPADLEPSEPAQRSLRPPTASAESAVVKPQVVRESIPASGAVLSTRPVNRSRRVAPLAARSEASPVNELRSALDPIYRQSGE